MKAIKTIFITALLLINMLGVGAALLPQYASAASNIDTECKPGNFLGFPAWYEYLEVGQEKTANGTTIDKCAIIGPKVTDQSSPDFGKFNWKVAIPRIGLAVIEIMLRLAGILAVVFVVYGGFRYIIAQGEPDKVKTARQTITNSLIGVVISIVASAAVSFLARSLTK